MVNDPISNLIIHLKNSNATGLPAATVTFSKMKRDILDILSKEGYIGKVKEASRKGGLKSLEVELLYTEDKKPKITGVKRLSKFSRRVYIKSANIVPVKNGYGLLILTTPKGILTGTEAKNQKVGGEVLFNIW